MKVYPTIMPEEALHIVLDHARPLPSLTLPLTAVTGKVLAADLYAPFDYPAQPTTTVDGFAVIAADETPRRQLIGEQLAGHYDVHLRVHLGEAARITTGAHLPAGADAVIMWEDVVEESGAVTLKKAVVAGENVRPAGVDIAAGALVLPAGSRLGPAEIGLLAMLGTQQVTVHSAPRVAILSTGDEVRELGERLAPGQLWDANRYALRAAALQSGAAVIDMGIVPDREEVLDARLTRAMQQANVLVTSGGASLGKRDLLKGWLADHGTLHFGRVFQKPGKPMTFATVGETAVFTLPGNPVSALVSFELYVRPFLLKLQGYTFQRRRVEAELTMPLKHAPDRIEFVRARLRWQDGRYRADTTGYQGSARLLSLVGANAVLRVPPDAEQPLPAGSVVEAWFITPQ